MGTTWINFIAPAGAAESFYFDFVYLSGDVTISSTSAANITGASYSLDSSSAYYIAMDVVLNNGGVSGQGVKYNITYPSGMTAQWGFEGDWDGLGGYAGYATASSSNPNLITESGTLTCSTNNSTGIEIHRLVFTVKTGGTSGTFQVQAAKNYSGLGNFDIKSFTRLKIAKLS